MHEHSIDAARRWQAAGTGSFEQLYEQHKPAVTRYLLGMCGDPLLADELAQETFVRAATKLLLFRGDAAFTTWLFRIARNTYLGWVERQRDAKIDTDTFNALPDQRADGDPEAQILCAEQRTAIQRVIAILPERQRTILLLRDLEGLSYAEIAAVLDMSLAAVKVNLHRARVRFREIYTRVEGDDDE
jgi:RNA polymerase sigma-70 factor (ECF subfamily)